MRACLQSPSDHPIHSEAYENKEPGVAVGSGQLPVGVFEVVVEVVVLVGVVVSLVVMLDVVVVLAGRGKHVQ